MDSMKRKETSELVISSIKKLNPRQSDMLYLYYFLGLTLKEIAETYSLSIKRVCELVKEARRNLKTIIESNGFPYAI
jgi:RNA polymerase sigma factor (sigma-70 family)